MLTLMRIAVIALMTGVVVGTSSLVAWADPDFFDGNAECEDAGCEVEAESEQSDSGSSGSDADAGSASGDEGAGTAEAEPSECDLDPACETIGLPGDDTEETPEVDPVEVAHAARDELELPEPQIAMSPGVEVPVLVQLPIWLWLEEEVWASQEAEAEVPGGAVTVTAEPAQAQWHMGDGHTVACDGPGVVYEAGVHDPAAASPDCGHTYTHASTHQPDGAYTVEVDLVWEVGWSASDGESGELEEVVTSSVMERTVIESHGLVTDVH